MIQRLSHTCVYVLDQDRAKDFYTTKLGFEVRNDVALGTFRWLTVGPKGQPDLEIVLIEPKVSPMLDEESASAIRTLLKKNMLGAGVFQVDDCRKTYDELKKKGVQFKGAPEERFYGTEAIMSDGLGNWFSMTQPK